MNTTRALKSAVLATGALVLGGIGGLVATAGGSNPAAAPKVALVQPAADQAPDTTTTAPAVTPIVPAPTQTTQAPVVTQTTVTPTTFVEAPASTTTTTEAPLPAAVLAALQENNAHGLHQPIEATLSAEEAALPACDAHEPGVGSWASVAGTIHAVIGLGTPGWTVPPGGDLAIDELCVEAQ